MHASESLLSRKTVCTTKLTPAFGLLFHNRGTVARLGALDAPNL